MTIYDVARAAGVSIATVSRVLNQKGSVSPKTEAIVKKAILDCNFTPNSIARGLGSGCVRMVGIVCADISDLFYATAVSILERELRLYGYETLLSCSGMELRNKADTIDLLLSKNVDAIILVGSVFKEAEDNSHIACAASKVPVIVINGELDIPGTYCFCSDEEKAVSEAVSLLYSGGRQRILYLYDANTPSGIKKCSGFRKGMENCGAVAGQDNMLRVPKDPEAVEGAIAALFSAGITFDGVIASEDLLAVGVINALQRRGIRVPEDVAAIGINNLQLCLCSRPSLTSIDIQLKPLCHAAVKALIAIFSRKEVPRKTIMQADCVFRESFPKSK